MCGRLNCNCSEEELIKACSYRKKLKEKDGYVDVFPKLVQPPGLVYTPSFNICPTETVPVLVHKSHILEAADIDDTDYVIVPMSWGMSPNSDATCSKVLHNARMDHMHYSTTFKPELYKDHKCVVLCDGYYEWKAEGKNKQPYFITQEKELLPEGAEVDDEANSDDWLGKPVMKLAGIFAVNTRPGAAKYSCTIITDDADKELSWIHNRMPINFKTVSAVEKWIDHTTTKTHDSLMFLRKYSLKKVPSSEIADKYKIKHYAVEKNVNNSRCKTEECIARSSQQKRQMTLDKWFGNKRGPGSSEKK